MARYSEHDTTAVYHASERFRDRCLQQDGSLIFDDETVWSLANLTRLHEVFVAAPDEGDRSFVDKFRDQVKPAGQAVVRLAAETLCIYFLFPSNVGGYRKRELVNEVLSWAGDALPAEHAVSAAFERGVGSGGQGYNTRRPFEIAFIIEVAIAWKKMGEPDRASALGEPWQFQSFVDGVDGAEARQARHMLLHLLFPDHFERIASGAHKGRVDEAFGGLVPEGVEDRDQRLFAIRQELEKLLPGKALDFYWEPLDAAWYDGGDGGDDLAPFDVIQHKKQVVLYGPPGTGKTFRAKRLAEQLIRTAALTQWGAARYFREHAAVKAAAEANVHRLQLHPAYSYEDFVRGLHLTDDGATEYRPGYLPTLTAAMDAEGADRLPHVLILDEINRTDLSRMLGECFSLLEDRGQAIEVAGNGAPMRLRIPPDLFVIGTMNLIDQSVEQIDFALRRRFLWVPCPFDPEAMLDVLRELWSRKPPRHNGWDRVADDFERLKAAAIALNDEIRSSALLGPNYEIGHTYFFDVVHFLRQDLAGAARSRRYYFWNRWGALPAVDRLWRLSLRPLLHEYLAGLDGASRENELGRLQDVFLRRRELNG